MVKVTDRPKLPASLRPDTMTKMPTSCRFGWHQWRFGKLSPGGMFQHKECMKCGRVKEVTV